MESLSTVSTIARIAQDVAAAVATVSRNKTRCQKLAKRVEGIGDLLRELDAVAASTPTDAATQRLLDRLQETLSRALRLVRSCQDSSCPRKFIACGRMAEQFDKVDREIDHCLLDLGIANRILIARHEKQSYHDVPVNTETVTLRIGMPCDDNAHNIKRCIRTVQGVTGVSVDATSTKEKFTVTVRSGELDIPSLLEKMKQQLNRNVEVITPAVTGAGMEKCDVKDHDKKANHKSAAVELKKTKAAPATLVGVNQEAAAPYIYLPFKMAVVPAADADASSMYYAPSHHGFMPYYYGTLGSHPARAQPQVVNRHRVQFKDASVNEYDRACYTKHTMNDADKDEIKGKMPEPVSKGAGEWEDNTAATRNVAAIGVPLRTVTAGVQELVPPPSPYGHGYWPYAHGRSTGVCCRCHCNSGGPFDAAAANNYNHHWQYPDQ